MEPKKMAGWMNNLGGGENVCGYDETANKMIVIAKKDGTTVSISLEKAHNVLKGLSLGMQTVLIDVFGAMMADKPSSNGTKEDKQ